jgi:2-polyprenyl-3-methyl-5-hydroxy-6-metoxy-1,4-benzoquinol methylase
MQPELTTPGPITPLTPLTYARRAEPAELPELMDSPCSYEEFLSFLRDLTTLNRLTRSYTHTLAFLDRIAGSECGLACVPAAASSRPLRILDVGSGGGDTLRAVARWAAARNLPVELTGIDLNPHSTRAAQELSSKDRLAANIEWHTADVFSYAPTHPPDVILSALFTHHLATPDIVRFLAWMEQHASLGWFINDLHRSRRAAFWFRFLPIALGWHRFIEYDGPVSLRRSFVPDDWQRLLLRANIRGASIESHPFNRLCVARIR